jgi:hypothetical protein
MEAVAWCAIGLLGTALGVLTTAYFRLSARTEEVRRDLGARIDAVRRDLGARIDDQTSRIDAQTARIDALNVRMDAQIHPHAG